MKIGAILNGFRLDFKDAIKEAASLGLDGVQIYANDEKLNTEMPAYQIKELKDRLLDNGLKVSALLGEFGCALFYNPDENDYAMDRQKKVMDLALEFGTNIVTTHIGCVPDDKNHQIYKNMHRVCKELAEYADARGGHFAIETGPERATELKEFLDGLGSKGVAVNLDPANLLMCAGDVPQTAVQVLKDYIVHTHAKDGVMLKYVGPKSIYVPQYFGLEPANRAECYKEVPLGFGHVDFDKYLKALEDIGYDGYLVVEGCGMPDGVKYMRNSAKFLEEKLKELNIKRG